MRKRIFRCGVVLLLAGQACVPYRAVTGRSSTDTGLLQIPGVRELPPDYELNVDIMPKSRADDEAQYERMRRRAAVRSTANYTRIRDRIRILRESGETEDSIRRRFENNEFSTRGDPSLETAVYEDLYGEEP